MPSIEELEAELVRLREERAVQAELDRKRGEQQIGNSVPAERGQEPASNGQSDPYAPTTWGEGEYDFRTPGGQLCRLRDLPIEELAQQGILDRITRLPGLTQELIDKAEGAPPSSASGLPDGETVKTLREVVDILVPLVVVAPHIWPLPAEGEDRVKGRVYVDTIPFTDRVAIMNRSVKGLQNLDAFRNQFGITR
jgi:hypothetical protein